MAPDPTPQPDAPGAQPGTVVFLHAHPDDEAIFTGGTLRLLADAGWTTVVAFATGGELGVPAPGAVGRPAARTADHRRGETAEAAAVLGVAAVEFLGYEDSGLPASAEYRPAPGSLAAAPLDEVGERVAALLRRHGAAALVTYDAHGIYGHPDHVVVHRAGVLGAELSGTPTRYDVTVDREYLHFVETHLVEEASAAGVMPLELLGAEQQGEELGPAGALGLAASGFGTPTVLVDITLDVSAVLEAKREAMAAHGSQIPTSSSALQLDVPSFAEVYGLEWYLRAGPPGPIDALPQR